MLTQLELQKLSDEKKLKGLPFVVDPKTSIFAARNK